jgi:chromosome partitioning protein
MKIIALANQKGGVAKTTSTYNLACLKAMAGNKVLMIDLDPQASLTISCAIEPGEKQYNTSHLFDGKTDPVDCVYSVKASKQKNLYIIPSDIDLAETETFLFAKTNREKLLKRVLKKLEQYFDYIFIDCPPQLGLLTMNALVAANEVIVPVKTDYLSYRGLRALLSTIENVQGDVDLNSTLKLAGIIATIHEKNVKDQRDILILLELKAPLLGVVKKGVDSYKSIIDGVPTVISNPKSDITQSYSEVANKI